MEGACFMPWMAATEVTEFKSLSFRIVHRTKKLYRKGGNVDLNKIAILGRCDNLLLKGLGWCGTPWQHFYFLSSETTGSFITGTKVLLETRCIRTPKVMHKINRTTVLKSLQQGMKSCDEDDLVSNTPHAPRCAELETRLKSFCDTITMTIYTNCSWWHIY